MTEQENLFEGQGSEDSAPVDKPDDRFHEFWAAYPHKQGKLQAEAAYLRMTGAGRKIDIGGKKMKVKRTHEQLMAALDKYKASKPSDRPWLNGSTFLNQRFVDFEDMAEESMHQKLARTGPRQPVTEFDKASAAGRWAHEIMSGEDGKRASFWCIDSSAMSSKSTATQASIRKPEIMNTAERRKQGSKSAWRSLERVPLWSTTK